VWAEQEEPRGETTQLPATPGILHLHLRGWLSMGLRGLIDRLIGYAGGGLAFVAAVAMVLLMLHIVIDVTGRYAFNNPLPGTLESVTYYYMVMVTALPFAYVTHHHGQIAVEMFTSWLPPRWISLLEAFAGVLMLVYVTVLAWKMGQEAVQMTIIGEVHDAGTMQFTTWPSRWIPPVALAVMACTVALRIVEDVREAVRP
jgi:TRAP-type C4-dicarboxylate transport system permease small subunit